MSKKQLLTRLVILMFFLFAADFITHKFYWYSSIWWLDMPMHFLSGLWVGLFFIYVLYSPELSLRNIFTIVSLVLIVGLLWEVWEVFTINYIGQTPFNALDTVSDLCFDAAGGLTAIAYFCYTRKNG